MRAITVLNLETRTHRGRLEGIVLRDSREPLYEIKLWSKGWGRYNWRAHIHRLVTFDELTTYITGPNPTATRALEQGLDK